MMRKGCPDTVTSEELPGRWLAGFAIEWANDDDPAGKRVGDWVEGLLDPRMQRLDREDPSIYWAPKTFKKGSQRQVTRWLDALAKKPVMSGALRSVLFSKLETVTREYGLTWMDGRGPVPVFRGFLGSPEALAAAGVLALASPELREGFGRCQWERCGRFFLAAGARTGPQRHYCPDRGCAGAPRVNRKRERDAAKG